jgi:hypothetical protein
MGGLRKRFGLWRWIGRSTECSCSRAPNAQTPTAKQHQRVSSAKAISGSNEQTAASRTETLVLATEAVRDESQRSNPFSWLAVAVAASFSKRRRSERIQTLVGVAVADQVTALRSRLGCAS